MLLDLNYSLLGIGCVVWTILLAFVSYIYIRGRQKNLLRKIDETNKMSRGLAEKNKEVEKNVKQSEKVESSTDGEEDEENDESPFINSDDIVLEAKTHEPEARDPFEYCEHIQGEVKRLKQKVTQKKFMKELTPNQLEEEREIRRKQMEAIFNLMAEKEGKFGVSTMDEMQSQMKMYL